MTAQPPSRRRLTEEEFNFLTQLSIDRQWLQINPPALDELWSSCDSDEQKHLLVELIERFEFLDGLKLVDSLNQTVSLIADTWKLQPQNTTIIAVSDDNDTDGSQAVLHMIKSRFFDREKWKESNFKNSLAGYSTYLRKNRNYVLFDDFVGSGDKLSGKVSTFKGYLDSLGLQSCNIYVCALAAMEASKPFFENYTYGAALWLKKGIEDHNSPTDAASKIKLMKQMEKKLMPRYNGQYVPSLGYKKTQALFSIIGQNCPNNVFPVFWWPKHHDRSARKTILSRFL